MTSVRHTAADAADMWLQDQDFRALFDASSLACLVVRPDYTIVEANTACLKMVMRTRDEVVGRHVMDAFPVDRSNVPSASERELRESLETVIRTGQQTVIALLHYPIPRPQSAGGGFEDRYWSTTHTPILDATGTVKLIMQQVLDVTDRKRDEEAFQRANERLEQRIQERSAELLASQERTRIFFEYSAEYHGVMRVRDDGSFIYEELNPAAFALYRASREQVIGCTTHEVLGAQEAATVNAHLAACLAGGRPYRYERTQGKRTIEALAVPVPGGAGAPARIIVTARDITEARALENRLRQAQKMEAVGQLTGGIAHDFNNLLTVVIGNLDRLERKLEDDKQRRAASMALEGARKAATLTHRLLAFSRKQPLEPKIIDINALVAAMYEILARTLGETITIETALDAHLWTTSADPNQVENALLNLALNARDAMPKGGRLTIRTSNMLPETLTGRGTRHRAPGEYVVLSVCDTGVGMSPAVLARAFEPFFTTKEVGHGSGLGLPMIYGFIEQSGGHVDIQSEEGVGTTVRLFLPRAHGVPATAEAPKSVQSVGPIRSRTILAVEDDDHVRDYTVSALRELGHEVLEAANGIEAMRVLAGDVHVDLLFTDVVLPGMNGRELARLAQQQRPGLKVLFTTGYERDALGPHDASLNLILKPFTVTQVGARIAAVFEDD